MKDQPKAQPVTNPYGSAHDLPSFVDMRQQLKVFKGLTLFVLREKRAEIAEIEAQMVELADVVDRFYERLGSRHWTFNDWMSLTKVAELLDETSTQERAERRLIELYMDPDVARIRMMQLRAVPGMRERQHLIDRARQEYEAERFDTCTLLLITVMDGFVNDFEADKRKGLAARDADEMVAWDSVAGHHLGLTNALKPFLATIKKRVDEEVFEVHRHGIVHGTVVNYDNVVVATKAWNLLFAVVDWSRATEKKAKEDRKPPAPSLRHTFERLVDHGRKTRAREEFVSWEVGCNDEDFEADVVVASTRDFVQAWQRSQWARIVPFMPPRLIASKTEGEAAAYAKSWYQDHDVTDVRLDKVKYPQSSVAEVWGSATIDGASATLRLRWVYYDDNGDVAPNADDGCWRLAVIAPNTYLVDEQGERLS